MKLIKLFSYLNKILINFKNKIKLTHINVWVFYFNISNFDIEMIK